MSKTHNNTCMQSFVNGAASCYLHPPPLPLCSSSPSLLLSLGGRIGDAELDRRAAMRRGQLPRGTVPRPSRAQTQQGIDDYI